MFTVVSVSCARFLGAPEGGPCFTVELLHQLLWFDIWNHAFREILGVLDTETRYSLISWVPIEGLIQFLFHWIWSGCAVVCHRRDWVTSHMVAWWPWSARRWRLSFGNPLFAHFTPSSRSQQSARSPVTWCCWSTMTGGMYFKCISTALLSRVASRHGGSGDS